jgi:N,N'-diacetyllegionaminate synthase
MLEIQQNSLNTRVEIIAEAACNHMGDTGRACEYVRHAATCGADTVKFQLFKTDALVNPGKEVAEFCRKAELDQPKCCAILEECENIGIDCLFSVFDLDSLEDAVILGAERVKVPSGQVFNLELLEKIAKAGLKAIVSTGMCSWRDVTKAYYTLLESGMHPDDMTFLQCTTAYPAPHIDANLNVIPVLKEALRCRVGYSDHTIGWSASVGAVALGATVIEKHFILHPHEKTPDSPVSLGPAEFRMMSTEIRQVSLALGKSIKRPCKSEREYFKRRDFRHGYGGTNEF